MGAWCLALCPLRVENRGPECDEGSWSTQQAAAAAAERWLESIELIHRRESSACEKLRCFCQFVWTFQFLGKKEITHYFLRNSMVCLHEFTASHVISLLASHREDPVVGRARYIHTIVDGGTHSSTLFVNPQWSSADASCHWFSFTLRFSKDKFLEPK